MKPVFIARQIKWYKLILVSQLFLMVQCSTVTQLVGDIKSNNQEVIVLEPAQPTSMEIIIVSEDLESSRDVVLQSPEAQQVWQQKTDFVSTQSGWVGWVTELEVEPSLDFNSDLYIANPVRMSTTEEGHGFFLVRNSWNDPHSLRIVFLLDFQQVPVIKSGERYDFYDLPIMEPQEERAFEFVFPALSEGFHQLSIFLLRDADNLSSDDTYRFFQQKSFSEVRYDLWVNVDKLLDDVVSIESASVGLSASGRVQVMELVISPDTETNEALNSLVLKPGEEYNLNLRLFNCGVECRKDPEVMSTLYADPLPLRIVVFWNDKLAQVADYNLLADAPDNLTLGLKVEAPTEPKSYQLNVVAFTIPGYSQFNNSLERVAYPQGLFSRRILIEVQP